MSASPLVITPTNSSSLASLRESLIKAAAHDQLSPTQSARTGATASSEESGAATQSLVASVASRRLQAAVHRHHSTPSMSASPPPPPACGDALDLPLSGVRSDASWASVSLPGGDDDHLPPLPSSLTTSNGEQLQFQEEEEEDEGIPMTDEEEEEMLRLPLTRSQSELRDWLRTTLAEARGDGTSTIDSEDALSAVVEVTSNARFGLNSTHMYSSQDGQRRLGSVTALSAASRTPSLIYSTELHEGFDHTESIRGLNDTYDLEELLGNQPSAEENRGEVEASVCSPVGLIASNESIHASDGGKDQTPAVPTCSSPPTPAPASADNFWKWSTLLLSLALASTHAWPFRQVVLDLLQHRFAQIGPDVPSLVEEQQLLPVVNNLTTHIDTFAIPVGKPLPLNVLSGFAALAAAALLYVIVVSWQSLWTSREPDLAHRVKRSSSPLLEADPVSILQVRDLIPQGVRNYCMGALDDAEEVFAAAARARCAPQDKAIATEWLGRTRYRLARARDCPDLMRSAVAAFERAIRLDSSKASARASLGRAIFVLGNAEGAIKPLEAAIRRDPTLAFAHGYLGKALTALGNFKLGEVSLREATRLDPLAYPVHGFLGEQLHRLGRTSEAKIEIEKAVQLRSDYPAAHARLAFIATEQLDKATSAKHLRLAIACRETGCVDDSLPYALNALQGPAPFFLLYFALPELDRQGRIDVIQQGLQAYPHEELFSVLLAATRRRSKNRAERSQGLSDLRRLEENLHRRVQRYTTPTDDVDLQGLFVLVLFASGKVKVGEQEYAKFWKRVAASTTLRDNPRIASVVSAIFELRRK